MEIRVHCPTYRGFPNRVLALECADRVRPGTCATSGAASSDTRDRAFSKEDPTSTLVWVEQIQLSCQVPGGQLAKVRTPRRHFLLSTATVVRAVGHRNMLRSIGEHTAQIRTPNPNRALRILRHFPVDHPVSSDAIFLISRLLTGEAEGSKSAPSPVNIDWASHACGRSLESPRPPTGRARRFQAVRR
jgi:hypothetical protein